MDGSVFPFSQNNQKQCFSLVEQFLINKKRKKRKLWLRGPFPILTIQKINDSDLSRSALSFSVSLAKSVLSLSSSQGHRKR